MDISANGKEIIPCCEKSKEIISSSSISGILEIKPSGLYFVFYSPIYKNAHLYVKILQCPNCGELTKDNRKEFLRSMIG